MFYDVEIVDVTNKTRFLQIDAESGAAPPRRY